MGTTTMPVPGSAEWWAQEKKHGVRRGRPPIALERIVSAGLELLDRAGGSEYSIRNVATLLGASTATLYRRVGGRPGLDALIVDHIFGIAVTETTTTAQLGWQEASVVGADALFHVLQRHRQVVPLLAAQVPSGPNSALLREQFVRRLLAEGFDAPTAARTYTTVAHYTVGFGLQLLFDPPTRNDTSRPQQLLPATAQVATHLDVELREEFLFGLTMLLAGIASFHTTTTP